jgi:hypothetical protein
MKKRPLNNKLRAEHKSDNPDLTETPEVSIMKKDRKND